LEAKKASLREELENAGALDEISPPAQWNARQRGIVTSLALFSAKVLIILVVFMVAVIYTGRVFDRRMQEFREATRIGGASFWTGLERELARAAAAESNVAVAKKQELLAHMHVVVERWRPFVREFEQLFINGREPPPGSP